VFLALACACATAADRVAAPAPAAQPAGVSVKKATALGVDGKETSQASATGGRIRIVLGGAAADAKIDFQKLVPYLDGYAFKGIYPDLVDTRDGVLEFILPDRYEARDLWKPLLRSPALSGVREITVSTGPEDGGREWPPTDFKNRPKLIVALFSRAWWLLLVGVVFVGLALWRLASKSGILRDSTSELANAQKLSPYSLAKTQAAVWFFLVFAAFVFIWLMTGNFNDVMTANTLALIGIGSGTTLGAAMIENAKSESEQQRRAQLEAELQTAKTQHAAAPSADLKVKIDRLEQLVRPVSRGWIKDLLTDVNGITLHRFQMLVWTVTLGVVFVVGVYQNLAMPQFDATLLGLMGISSGVYLGFKIPEKQV